MQLHKLPLIGITMLTLLGAARAQTAEQLQHCADLTTNSTQLLDGEQTIKIMEDYRKGTVSFGSEETKNAFIRKLEALENQESTHDLQTLKREQLKKILQNERQIVHDCSEISNKRAQASSLELIGSILVEQDQSDDAIPVLQRCATINPDYAACWEKLGEASASLGRTSEAKGFFKKAIEVGGFDEMNVAAINRAKHSLFMLEHPGGDPMCAPGMPGLRLHLEQCRDYLENSNPAEPKPAPIAVAKEKSSLDGVFLFDPSLRPASTRPTTGDMRPIYVFSGRIKNRSVHNLSDVTVRVAIFVNGTVVDQADVHIHRIVAPNAVTSFSEEIRILPPSGKWNWAFNVINAQ